MSSQGHCKWHNHRVQTQLTSDLFITSRDRTRKRESTRLSIYLLHVSQECQSENCDICRSSEKHFESHKPV